MRLLHPAVLACALTVVGASIISGQPQQRPAAQDDLLAETRALRADMNRAAENAIRAQLVTARLTMQVERLSTLSQQLNNVRQQLAQSQLTLAPFTLQLKQAQESNSEILAPLRNTVEQAQKRDQELRAQEAELSRLIASEENRLSDFNSQLDQIERAMPASSSR